MIERRSAIRRDINDLFRNDDGKVSGTKIGTYAGQIIAGHLLMKHSPDVIAHWDSMTVLFMVLVAPEFYKRFLTMRYGSATEEKK